jgi:hypothetical protein
VVVVAGGRKGARNAEQDHFLAVEDLGDVDLARATFLHDLELAVGKSLASRNRHHQLSVWMKKSASLTDGRAVGNRAQ